MLLFHVPIGYNVAAKQVLSSGDASETSSSSATKHRVASFFSLSELELSSRTNTWNFRKRS